MTPVQIVDWGYGHWEKVLLPDGDIQSLDVNMLKQSLLAKIGWAVTTNRINGMRVLRNSKGMPHGKVLKGGRTPCTGSSGTASRSTQSCPSR